MKSPENLQVVYNPHNVLCKIKTLLYSELFSCENRHFHVKQFTLHS